jgi:hypothetical protein
MLYSSDGHGKTDKFLELFLNAPKQKVLASDASIYDVMLAGTIN